MKTKEQNEREARERRKLLSVQERYGVTTTGRKSIVIAFAGARPRDQLALIDFAEVERRLLARKVDK